MNSKWLPKKFKCPHCDKLYSTTYCSNRIWKGKWVCKMCNKLFEGDVLELDEYAEDIDQQAFAQDRESS